MIPFTVQGPPQADNGRVTVRIAWTSPQTDWDLYIVNAQGQIVGQSAQGGTTGEAAVVPDPPAGDYRAVVVNYDGGETDDWRDGAVQFQSPLPTTIGPKESWNVTCENRRGQVRAAYPVIIDRGETVDLGDACRKKRHGRA